MKKIVFVSHNIFGHECLKEIIRETKKNKNGKVEAVITRKFKPNISDYCRYGELCKENNIPLYEIDNINSKKIKSILRKISPDVMFVFGWSQIIDKEILNISRDGCIGTHPSILPKNRGSAAMPWQILNDEKISGVALFYLEEGLDSGDIIAQETFEIKEDETAESFYQKVIETGKRIIQKNLNSILENKNKRMPQNNALATYLCRRTPEDGLINWSGSSEYIHKFIRAIGKPYPGAYTYYQDKKIVILESELPKINNYIGTIGQIVHKVEKGILVQTGDGLLTINRIYVEGEGEVKPADYLKVGHKFGMNVEDEIMRLRRNIMIIKNKLGLKE